MVTDWLYARPNYLSGLASTLDIGSTLVKEYNRSGSADEADFKALKSDWQVVGQDFYSAIDKFKEANEQK